MDIEAKYEARLHYIMSFVGGVFAIYALMEHANMLGSAQTSNMILFVKGLQDWDLPNIIMRLGNILIYGVGIIFTLLMAKYKPSAQKMTSILIDCLAALILGLLPKTINPIIALYPIAFAMSVQWCSFREVCGNVSATTFSTNNFRQTITSAFYYFSDGGREYLFRMKIYLFTLLSFHMGVAVTYFIWKYIPHFSIWIAFAPLLRAAVLTNQINKKHSAEN